MQKGGGWESLGHCHRYVGKLMEMGQNGNDLSVVIPELMIALVESEGRLIWDQMLPRGQSYPILP